MLIDFCCSELLSDVILGIRQVAGPVLCLPLPVDLLACFQVAYEVWCWGINLLFYGLIYGLLLFD